ncbi:30S ribosomal protein S3 [bacterium]|nr:30S ribosomal protein S3 [bacterium]
MGQKTHPKGFRLGVTENWDSTWYADRSKYADYLIEDIKIRNFLEKELFTAQLSRVVINRYIGKVIINCFVVRLGIAVGKGGARREELISRLRKELKTTEDIHLDFYEESKPDLSARVVAGNIITQIEKRINFRRVLRQTMKRCMQSGAKGVKLMVAGRLNGAEMSRTEYIKRGKVPLHTLRAKISYHSGVARTIAGAIGVKVWIYTGEVVPQKKRVEEAS